MRIKLLTIALALLIAQPAFAQKTKSVLGSEITSQFPNNTTGAITPQILRNVTNDFVNSWQQFPAVNPQTGITYTFLASDYGALVTFNNAAPIAAALPAPTGSFGTGYNVFIRNIGAGSVTITPAGSLINGAATLTLTTSQSVWIVSDGVNYQVWNNTSGTVTSFNETVPNPFTIQGVPCTTTCAISVTISGTSGGIPYYDTASSLSSSAALTANGVVIGGGAGASPTSTAAGVTGTVLRGGSPPAFTPTPVLGTSGTTGGSLGFFNGTSGSTTLSPSTGALGSSVLTLPIATDTLIAKATTDTLTNKTYNTAGAGNVFSINSTQISAVTGTGSTVVLQSGATLTGNTLATAISSTSLSAVSFNDATISATTGTYNVLGGKVLTVNNTMELSGVDASPALRYSMPALSATIAALNIKDQQLSGGVNVTSQGRPTGGVTVDCGLGPLQYIANTGPFTITAPTSDGSCILLVTNGAGAGTITFSGFNVGSNTGDALTTVNSFSFSINIWRITGISTVSGFRIAAHQ